MTYLDFIKSELGNNFKTIVEEIGYLNEINDPEVLVVRKLQGPIYRNSSLLPILIEVHTTDVLGTMEVMTDFVKRNQSKYVIDGLNYIKQNYNTPFVSSAFNEFSQNMSNIIQVSATLVITDNISDIEWVKIDNEDIYFDTVDENYVATEFSTKPFKDDDFSTTIQGFINKLQISSIVFSSGFNNKVRNIKNKILSADTKFEVEIKYSDSDVTYKYDMKLGSYSVSNSSANVPFSTIALTE